MRGAILSLLLLCCLVGQADARLFWQTYGSTVPTPEGCEWNTNNDYFIPRHCDTCRYGLYSPCKKSCATSPACRRESAIYPGYCSPYGCAHYCWRNHLYAHKCGCCPVPYNGPIRPACGCPLQRCLHGGVCVNGVCAPNSYYGGTCQGGMCSNGMCYGDAPQRIAMNHDCMNDLSQSHSECGYLPNVESNEFQILGSISLSGDPLLSSLQLGAHPLGMPMLPGQGTPGSTMSMPMQVPMPQPVIVEEQPRPLFAPKDNMPVPPIVPGD